MEEWLGHPAVQAAVLPFAVALIFSAGLARTRFLAIAQAAGFLACATLAIGWSFESLSSAHKLALIGGSTAVLALVLEAAQSRWRACAAIIVAILAAASVWMLWRVLAQKEPGPAAVAALLSALYVAAVAGGTFAISGDTVRGGATGLVLGLGAGATCILGASALLGVTGISVAAAAGATLLVQMLRGQPAPAGRSISLPAATVAALATVAAVATAELPWYCLPPLALVPVAARFAPGAAAAVGLRAIIASVFALIPALAAIALAWFRPF